MKEESNISKKTNLTLIQSYNMIRIDLAVEKGKLKSLELQRDKLLPYNEYKSPVLCEEMVDGDKNEPAVEELILKVRSIQSEIVKQKKLVNELQKNKERLDQEIEDIQKSCSDIETKVFYYHYVRRLKLYEVARLLRYSEDYIRKINANLARRK